MIKHCICKGAGYVTDTAILVRYNVVCILTNCTTRTAVMTGVTPFTDNFGTGMIDECSCETIRVMARSTISSSVLMNCSSRRHCGFNAIASSVA